MPKYSEKPSPEITLLKQAMHLILQAEPNAEKGCFQIMAFNLSCATDGYTYFYVSYFNSQRYTESDSPFPKVPYDFVLQQGAHRNTNKNKKEMEYRFLEVKLDVTNKIYEWEIDINELYNGNMVIWTVWWYK